MAARRSPRQPGARSPARNGSTVSPWLSGARVRQGLLDLPRRPAAAVRRGTTRTRCRPRRWRRRGAPVGGPRDSATGRGAAPTRLGGDDAQRGRGADVERDRGWGPRSPSRRCWPRRRPRPETTARCAAPATGSPTARAAPAGLRARLASGKSWATSMPAAARASASQRSASWSSSPVPEAIETLVAASPKRVSSRCSPMEPQRATRPTSAGRSRASQRSLAGQYEACRWQPVRRVEGRVVERVPQQRGVPRAARVGPREDRRDRVVGGVEAEQPVPEGGDADAWISSCRGARSDRVQAGATASSSRRSDRARRRRRP